MFHRRPFWQWISGLACLGLTLILLAGCATNWPASSTSSPAPTVPLAGASTAPTPDAPPAKENAASSVPRGIEIKTAGRTTVVGPYNDFSNPPIWIGDGALAFSVEQDLRLLADLQNKTTYTLSNVKTYGDSVAVSPDRTRLAWIAEGKLTVRTVTSSLEQCWKLMDAEDGYGEMLAWSPNGRYLLGQSHPDADVATLWSLDTATGKLTGLVKEERHAFRQPQWSADSYQVVILEALRAHSSSSARQWRWVNLPRERTK